MTDFDSTAPWFEFLSYQFCCESLGIEPKLQKFLRYEKYVKTIKNDDKRSL